MKALGGSVAEELAPEEETSGRDFEREIGGGIIVVIAGAVDCVGKGGWGGESEGLFREMREVAC